jgi:nucleoside-diphosphate-sugar epimerase
MNIQNNVIWNAHKSGTRRLIFLGSSCIYPRDTAQPIHERQLLSGPLEYTNRPYAIAKIAGLELVNCLRRQYGRDYFSVMPTNLYGERDNFDPVTSHVVPALIRKFCAAKRHGHSSVTLWGSGRPLREIMHVDDCASAIIFLAEKSDVGMSAEANSQPESWCHVNIGSGHEVTIADLASVIREIVGFTGDIIYDREKPDGTYRKRLDISLLEGLGWRGEVGLRSGLERTIKYFQENFDF